MNPGLAGFRQFLIVLAKPPAPAQPCQCPLYHPPSGQHLEAMAVRAAAHHSQQPSAGGPSPLHQPARVGCVDSDVRSRGNRPTSLASTSLTPSRSWMLAALITTAKSNPMVSTTMCRLRPDTLLPALLLRGSFSCGPHRLAVDEGPAGGGIPALALPDHAPQRLLHPFPSGIGSPLTEILPDRPPRRQVVGHHPPGNATARSRTREIAESTSPCSMGPSSSTVKSRSSEKL